MQCFVTCGIIAMVIGELWCQLNICSIFVLKLEHSNLCHISMSMTDTMGLFETLLSA